MVVTGPRVSVPARHSDRDIPWLLLGTTGTGPGLFGEVDFVQRLATRGGVAPTGACPAGASLGCPTGPPTTSGRPPAPEAGWGR
jgi:hypothetical protein